MSIYDKLFKEDADEDDFDTPAYYARLNKQAEDHLINLALLLVKEGKYKQAEKALRQTIEIYSTSAKAHVTLGTVLEIMHRDSEAEAEYVEAVKLEPDKADAHVQLGWIWYKENRFDEAEEELRRAVEIDPESLEGHTYLGSVLYKTDRYDEAESEFRRAIQIDPDAGTPHRNLGLMLCDISHDEEALRQLEIARDLHKKEGKTEIARQLDSTISELRDRIEGLVDVRPQVIPRAGQTGALESLLKAAQDRYNLTARSDAIYAIGELGDTRAVPILIRILQEGASPEEARKALEELYSRGPLMISRQTSDFNTIFPKIREAAAVALGLLHDRRALHPLMEALQADWAWNVRAAAGFALGELGEAEAIPILERLAKTQPEKEVRNQAKQALKKLKKKPGLFGILGNHKNPKH